MRRSQDLKRLDEIAQAIYDKKGSTIIAIDVRDVSSLTEFFIIAEGNVERHVAAIARFVIETQKEAGFTPYHVEGLQEGDWVVIDYGHIVLHLFIPDLREKYGLETLWQKGRIIDLKLNVSELHGETG
jgi:ribosome-associated protein